MGEGARVCGQRRNCFSRRRGRGWKPLLRGCRERPRGHAPNSDQRGVVARDGERGGVEGEGVWGGLKLGRGGVGWCAGRGGLLWGRGAWWLGGGRDPRRTPSTRDHSLLLHAIRPDRTRPCAARAQSGLTVQSRWGASCSGFTCPSTYSVFALPLWRLLGCSIPYSKPQPQ